MKTLCLTEKHAEWIKQNSISLTKYVRKKIDEDLNKTKLIKTTNPDPKEIWPNPKEIVENDI